MGRRARQGTAVLLAVFGLVLVFAYPLAAPIPAVPLVVFVWREWRRKLRAGEPVFRLRDLYRGRRSLLWLIPLAVLLAVPAIGVGQKAVGAAEVLAPGQLAAGLGAATCPGFIPFNYFVSLPGSLIFVPLTVGVFALAAYGLWRRPRSLTWGLGGLLAIGVLLARVPAPPAVRLLLPLQAAGLHRAAGHGDRGRGRGPAAALGPALASALLAVAAAGSVVAEIAATGSQLPQATIQLAVGPVAARRRLGPPRHVAAAAAVGGVLPGLAPAVLAAAAARHRLPPRGRVAQGRLHRGHPGRRPAVRRHRAGAAPELRLPAVSREPRRPRPQPLHPAAL